jgi:hypothetical protein
VNPSQSKEKKIAIKKHMTVRIPRGITEAIEDFLTTDQAAKMGFDSKADVVTTAVRRLLMDYGYYVTIKNHEHLHAKTTEKKKETLSQ